MSNNSIWYKKVDLTDDISLRYFYHFKDRPHLEGKWVIKVHSTKRMAEISKEAAHLIAVSHDKTLDDYTEILGVKVPEGYRKITITRNIATRDYTVETTIEN